MLEVVCFILLFMFGLMTNDDDECFFPSLDDCHRCQVEGLSCSSDGVVFLAMVAQIKKMNLT